MNIINKIKGLFKKKPLVLDKEMNAMELKIYNLKIDLMKAEENVAKLKLQIGILTPENID